MNIALSIRIAGFVVGVLGMFAFAGEVDAKTIVSCSKFLGVKVSCFGGVYPDGVPGGGLRNIKKSVNDMRNTGRNAAKKLDAANQAAYAKNPIRSKTSQQTSNMLSSRGIALEKQAGAEEKAAKDLKKQAAREASQDNKFAAQADRDQAKATMQKAQADMKAGQTLLNVSKNVGASAAANPVRHTGR